MCVGVSDQIIENHSIEKSREVDHRSARDLAQQRKALLEWRLGQLDPERAKDGEDLPDFADFLALFKLDDEAQSGTEVKARSFCVTPRRLRVSWIGSNQDEASEAPVREHEAGLGE